MRVLRPKQDIPLSIPPALTEVDVWIIVGLDLSLSRTGWSISTVSLDSNGAINHSFITIGSFKPEDTSAPIWMRSILIGRALRFVIDTKVYEQSLVGKRIGLLFTFEHPTPQNDFLTSINRIVHTVFFKQSSSFVKYPLRILSINASTLRSLMGLTMRGSKNKKENILRAYEYVSKDKWPSMDTDSCDAVLLSMIGQYTASIMLGASQTVPKHILTALCNANKDIRGKGTRVRTITKGLLHRSEYWYSYSPEPMVLQVKNAENIKRVLERHTIII